MSPFLGDEDNQTLSNVLAATCYFDEDAFEHVSAEARDFISNLLIREKGWARRIPSLTHLHPKLTIAGRFSAYVKMT